MNKRTVVLPRELTAVNGAKSLLSGEFSVSVTEDCNYCDATGFTDYEMTETCDYCNGDGAVNKEVIIDWDTIKDIYKKIVENMEIK